LLRRQETYRARFKADRAKKDAALMAAIKAAKQAPLGIDKDQGIAVLTQPRHRNGIVPDIIPDINSCSLNNGSCNNSTRNKAPLSFKSGDVDLLMKKEAKELDRSQFTTEELAFIDLYHRICLPTGLGFLPVTKRSKELDNVLDKFADGFDEEEWAENFRDAINVRREVFKTNPRQYNTLVQICWKLNY
jgi:hypothetical protein